jgi:transposase InsO family protein
MKTHTACGSAPVRHISAPGTLEGFFGLLKNVNFHHRDWSGWTAEEFMAEVDRWVLEHNERRVKQSLGWKTPMEYRMAALTDVA